MIHKLRLLIYVMLFLFLYNVTGCTAAGERNITITGSTALAPLVKHGAEDFMENHPGVVVRVTGGGSFGGFYQVLSGTADIGMSCIQAPHELREEGLIEYPFVSLPIVFVAHPGVDAGNLTPEQARKILTGGITNWSDLNGGDQSIILVHRQKSSGIRLFVEEEILFGQEFNLHAATLDSCGSLCQVVATTPGAIGYSTMFYADDSVKILDYDNIPCRPEYVRDGDYSLVVEGVLLTKGEPSGLTKEFIDYITSEQFLNGRYENLGFIN